MRKFFLSTKTIIAHNCMRADIPWIERILGIKITARIIDTLALSWALFPDMNNHGLYDWGQELGIPKVEIEDWVNLPVERYIERCEQDVRINYAVWIKIYEKLLKLYDNPEDMNRYIDYLSFKMYTARLKEQNRWKLDVVQTKQAIEELSVERDKRISELASAMPRVPIYATKSVPKKLYNKDGELTKLGQVWFERLSELKLPKDTESVEFLSGYEEPNPGSNKQIKDWLFSLGWKPATFKYVKDEATGKKREIPQINQPPQKGGGVCPSVQALFAREPKLEALDGVSILSHRIGLLNGFIRDVSPDGYLQAKVAGLTNTLRWKHAEIVNLPRVDRKYASAVRSSLVALDGYLLCGSDMSGLEDRLKQHYIYPFDPDYVQEMMVDDYDPHLSLALSAGALSENQVEAYKNGTDKSIKPIRDIYKNGNYSCQYNAYPPTIARTCGVSVEKGKEIFDAYWEKNWAIKEVVKQQVIKYVGDEMFLLNPISKFWYSLRTENDIFSTLVQGTAAYAFDIYLGFVLKEDTRLIGDFHDEFILHVQEGQKEQTEKLCLKAIEQTNQFLNLNRKLDVGIQFGQRYSEIH